MHFLFDAQMPLRLAKGLPLIDKDNLKEIKIQISHADELDGLGQGATDYQVIQKAYELDAIIVSEDDDFKRIKANKELIIKLKVGYVLYKPPKHGSRYWEKALGIIQAWERLKEMINSIEKPFILKIDKDGKIHRDM
jgi:predicted nuclease of predicted toxin-antitoxin system